VSLFDALSGALVRRLGRGVGAGDGQFNRPYGIRLQPGGEAVVVADYWNNRVCVASTADGSFVTATKGGDWWAGCG
jgi:hypothetical protein